MLRSFGAFVLVLFTASFARGQMVTFDFSGLAFFDRDRAISEYMSSVYGSEVETDGAFSSNNRSDIAPGERDFFIATSLQLFDRGNFHIYFLDTPIIGAQFEGHVIDATLGDDFVFRALSGDDLVYEFAANEGVEIFPSGWLEFSEPVDHLYLSDQGRKDVGIDDLVVQVVPDPATGLLLLAGLVGHSVFRYRFA